MNRKVLKFLDLSLFFVALTGPLQAGNVFMKNGYIIQGPIVERSDGSIVLGWPNGKVTIHQRFIDSVVYDPTEEKRLQDLEQHASSESTGEESPGILGTAEEPEELPMDPDRLVQIYVINTAKATKPGEEGATGTADPSGHKADGAQSPEASLTTVARPDELLGDRVEDASLGFAIRPPKGWSTEKAGEAFQVLGPAAENGLHASLNVVRSTKGPLSGSEYAAILKEENGKEVRDFEVLNEGPRTIGAHPAYEILGRGARAGRVAVIRQVLIEGPEYVWLVSAFVPVPNGEAAAPLLEESLKTFELTAK